MAAQKGGVPDPPRSTCLNTIHYAHFGSDYASSCMAWQELTDPRGELASRRPYCVSCLARKKFERKRGHDGVDDG